MDYKIKGDLSGASKIPQLKYNEIAKADKQLQVLAVPSSVIADATSAQKVGKGNLLRIKGTAAGYIAFDADGSLGAPSVATQDALETEAGFFLIVAPDEFIRTSVAMRIEIIED